MATNPGKGNFNLYDLLGNIIPGSLLISTSIILLPNRFLSLLLEVPSAGIIMAIFLSYLTGSIIQKVASEAERGRSKFENTIDAARVGNTDANLEPNRGHSIREVYVRVSNRVPQFWAETLYLTRYQNDRPIRITKIEQEIWKHYESHFETSEGFDDYDRLLGLMTSNLETQPGSKALRFQALRNFHRGMWITCYLIFVSMIFAFLDGLIWGQLPIVTHGLLFRQMLRSTVLNDLSAFEISALLLMLLACSHTLSKPYSFVPNTIDWKNLAIRSAIHIVILSIAYLLSWLLALRTLSQSAIEAIRFSSPLEFFHPVGILFISLVSLGLSYLFWELKEDLEEQFISSLMTDVYNRYILDGSLTVDMNAEIESHGGRRSEE